MLEVQDSKRLHLICLWKDESGREQSTQVETVAVNVLPLRHLFGRSLPWWKRAVDIVGAATGLVLLSPVMLLIALYIKTVSPGPVFFKQKRIGYLGKEFTMWKFRSMHVGADAKGHQEHMVSIIRSSKDPESEKRATAMRKLGRDNRIIPLGEPFRKSCLDEIPQLLNVLLGDMSLIGPRPALAYEVAEYLRWHAGRFDTVPGMTGLWQVSGKNNLSFKEMVRLDIRYARHRSFWFDAKILLKTIPAIIAQARDTMLQKRERIEGAGAVEGGTIK
jgi:lipopolysaccharide/colanic/teichoic acid biosynthesis glycosyltransferase